MGGGGERKRQVCRRCHALNSTCLPACGCAASWQSFNQFVSEAALNIEFDPPAVQIPRRWTFAPFVRLIDTRFEMPNPIIDARVRRRDDEWRVGAQLDAPLTATLGVSALAQYAKTSSNLPNYRTDNWSFAIGPTARF